MLQIDKYRVDILVNYKKMYGEIKNYLTQELKAIEEAGLYKRKEL